MIKRCLLLVILIGCVGCSSKPRHSYTIGIDPSFFPQDFEGKEMYVLAFTNELLQEIGKVQRVEFRRSARSWDNLLSDLNKKEVDAILSPIDPNFVNLQKYTFSNLYLETGPVLVTLKSKPRFQLDRIKNGFIGVIANTKSAYFVETQANLMPEYFGNSGNLCTAVQSETIDGALVQVIPAIGYVNDLFEQDLQIDTLPMLNEGLRMIRLKEQEGNVILDFNEGLARLKKKGIYKQLLKKWGLFL